MSMGVFWIVTPSEFVGGYHVSKEYTSSIFTADVLKMEAVCSSEMLVSTYKSTRRYNPEDRHEENWF
jgi:hypothetical protein